MLKSALVDKKTKPDYDQVRAASRQIMASASAACQDWHNAIIITGDEIMSMPLNLFAVGTLTDSLQKVPPGSRQRSWQNVFKNL